MAPKFMTINVEALKRILSEQATQSEGMDGLIALTSSSAV